MLEGILNSKLNFKAANRLDVSFTRKVSVVKSEKRKVA